MLDSANTIVQRFNLDFNVSIKVVYRLISENKYFLQMQWNLIVTKQVPSDLLASFFSMHRVRRQLSFS